MVRFDPEEWLAVDPDPDTRRELEKLMAEGGSALAERFDGRLAFGTAGIRGRLGAGPLRMNRVLVRSVAAAVGTVVARQHTGTGPPAVVIAHDARHRSAEFARDSARVLAGMGIRVRLIDGVQPTPLLAFAVLHYEAAAGVMVTASHNPPADNGYKVYWSDGVQIVPPIDEAISAAIDDAGLVAPDLLAGRDHPLISVCGEELEDAYVTSRVGLVTPDGPRALKIVYTPMHGVGGPLVDRVLTAAGFDSPIPVAAQHRPDPDFPTVSFPNPEEPGALDLALELAEAEDADIVMANDPDADRLAVAVPDVDGWRQLSGNEVGALLADHLLERTSSARPLVATTVVSSRLLSHVAAERHVEYAETLTGFKWLMRPALERPDLDFVFGYEEALGYAVDGAVRDKDGIAALLVFAELAAELSDRGHSVVDHLHEIYRRFGVHRTAQRSIRFEGATSSREAAMARLRAHPPESVGGVAVLSTTDLLSDSDDFPVPTDAVVLDLAGGARLVARPSGTEPKLKLYGEVIADAGPSVRAAEWAADEAVDELLESFERTLGPV